MHTIKWAILLSVFWLLLSGYIQPLLLSFGVVSVVIVLIVLRRMDALDQEPKKLGSGLRIARYLSWLIVEIVKSSIHVTKLIWSPARQLDPTLSKIPLNNVPKTRRVLYANSITLTPGTLSVDLDNDEITVHALQADSIEKLKEGRMEQKISGIWKDADQDKPDTNEGGPS